MTDADPMVSPPVTSKCIPPTQLGAPTFHIPVLQTARMNLLQSWSINLIEFYTSVAIPS